MVPNHTGNHLRTKHEPQINIWARPMTYLDISLAMATRSSPPDYMERELIRSAT